MSNPFLNEYGKGALDAASRIQALERFTEDQLISALCVPNLQKAVKRKIMAKLRNIERKKANKRDRLNTGSDKESANG